MLGYKEKELLLYLVKTSLLEFTPIGASEKIGVTNKTVINRCVKLTSNGFLIPNIVKERVRSCSLSEYVLKNSKEIISKIKNS